MTDVLVVLCPCPDAEVAAALARRAVEEGWAACVQRLGSPITSWYRWEGDLCEEKEHLLLLKTSREAWPRLRDGLAAAHPYEVPEILALPADGLPAYLAWVGENCREERSGP